MRRQGFTLLEVTLAMAIFAIALVVLTAAFSNTLVSLGTFQRQTDSDPYFEFARKLIVSVPSLDDFEDGATLDLPDDVELSWTAEVEPANIVDLFLAHVHMTLTLPDQKEPIQRDEDLYLIRPTWSDPIDRSNRINDAKDELENRIEEAKWQR